MGIDVQGLNCLLYARTFGIFGSTVTMGRQCVHLKQRYLSKTLKREISSNFAAYCEPLLQEHFGSSKVDSVDMTKYEHATIIQDMNLPISQLLPHFKTLIDFGTLEHVFNVPQALLNMWALCEENGQILHVLPANNFCGHGFWQFSPELFLSMYRRENGFVDTEVFLARTNQPAIWYRVKSPKNGQRINIRTLGEVYVVVRTIMTKRPTQLYAIQQSDYLDLWAKDEPQPQKSTIAKKFLSEAGLKEIWQSVYWRMTGLHPSLEAVKIGSLINF